MPKMTRVCVALDGIDASSDFIIGDFVQFSIDRHLFYTVPTVKVGAKGSLGTLNLDQIPIFMPSTPCIVAKIVACVLFNSTMVIPGVRQWPARTAEILFKAEIRTSAGAFPSLKKSV